MNFSIYVKPHVIGRYCVLNINKNTPNEIKNGGQNYGGGLQGVLLKDMGKWGNNWTSEDGTKNKILIVDTHDIDLWYVSKTRAASWFILDRKNFNDILNLEYTDEQLKLLSWEQVMEIISNINAGE